jgi:fructose-1,6-bisphosphatase class II
MNIEQSLAQDFLRVVETAAIACARSIGHGDRKYSDFLAVEAMRHSLETVPMDGTIVIGEGERDEAPMLYIGEKVGMGPGHLQVDIAVDPLEGTNLCATGAANAIAVMAASERGGLLYAPDLYMEKLVVGPSAKGKVSLDAPVGDNLNAIAKALNRKVSEITVVGPGTPAARPAHRRHPQGRCADSVDRRRRLECRHRCGRERHQRPCGDGHRRSA